MAVLVSALDPRTGIFIRQRVIFTLGRFHRKAEMLRSTFSELAPWSPNPHHTANSDQVRVVPSGAHDATHTPQSTRKRPQIIGNDYAGGILN